MYVFVRCRSDLSASAVLYAHDWYCRGLGRVLVLIVHASLPTIPHTPVVVTDGSNRGGIGAPISRAFAPLRTTRSVFTTLVLR